MPYHAVESFKLLTAIIALADGCSGSGFSTESPLILERTQSLKQTG
ncbi:MAG: hypothetical protein ACXU9U_04270 [Parachlamydiaceae bacterium]